jgi:hypothetical protein
MFFTTCAADSFTGTISVSSSLLEVRLYRKGKGKEANLSYIGNALTENRQGLVVEAELGPQRELSNAKRPG